jgi:hypothetical protein
MAVGCVARLFEEANELAGIDCLCEEVKADGVGRMIGVDDGEQ